MYKRCPLWNVSYCFLYECNLWHCTFMLMKSEYERNISQTTRIPKSRTHIAHRTPFMQCGNISYSNQCRLNAWARWAVARGTHANLWTSCFFMLKHWFCQKYSYNIYLILSTNYIFIPVRGCVSRGPSELLWPGDYFAVKTMLHEKNNYIDRLISR